jgi:hypothetical protein
MQGSSNILQKLKNHYFRDFQPSESRHAAAQLVDSGSRLFGRRTNAISQI